jgi:hypothetical protein
LGKLLAFRYIGEGKLRGDMVWSIAARVLVTVMFLVLGEARAAADGAPHACRIGLYVTALGDFDLEASSFGADLRLWSLCPAGAGDVRPLATADLTNGMNVARGEIRTEQQGDRIYAHQRITGRFWHHWHVVTFPFDRHRLDITVEDTVLDRSLFRYEPDTVQSGLSPSFHLPGWRVAGFEVVEEPHPYPTTLGNPSLEEGQTLSRFRTSIFLERHDYMGFVKLTAALYAATLIALLAFFSDPNHPSIYGGRMSLIVGALFAVVVNLHTSDRAPGRAGPPGSPSALGPARVAARRLRCRERVSGSAGGCNHARVRLIEHEVLELVVLFRSKTLDEAVDPLPAWGGEALGTGLHAAGEVLLGQPCAVDQLAPAQVVGCCRRGPIAVEAAPQLVAVGLALHCRIADLQPLAPVLAVERTGDEPVAGALAEAVELLA